MDHRDTNHCCIRSHHHTLLQDQFDCFHTLNQTNHLIQNIRRVLIEMKFITQNGFVYVMCSWLREKRRSCILAHMCSSKNTSLHHHTLHQDRLFHFHKIVLISTLNINKYEAFCLFEQIMMAYANNPEKWGVGPMDILHIHNFHEHSYNWVLVANNYFVPVSTHQYL
jgi:hypothetical protein